MAVEHTPAFDVIGIRLASLLKVKRASQGVVWVVRWDINQAKYLVNFDKTLY